MRSRAAAGTADDSADIRPPQPPCAPMRSRRACASAAAGESGILLHDAAERRARRGRASARSGNSPPSAGRPAPCGCPGSREACPRTRPAPPDSRGARSALRRASRARSARVRAAGCFARKSRSAAAASSYLPSFSRLKAAWYSASGLPRRRARAAWPRAPLRRRAAACRGPRTGLAAGPARARVRAAAARSRRGACAALRSGASICRDISSRPWFSSWRSTASMRDSSMSRRSPFDCANASRRHAGPRARHGRRLQGSPHGVLSDRRRARRGGSSHRPTRRCPPSPGAPRHSSRS